MISGGIDVFQIDENEAVITITIGDYLAYLTEDTKELAKNKLRHFLISIKSVLLKILDLRDKVQHTKIALKALIFFKREDVKTSQILDFDYETEESNGETVMFMYEKFV